MDDALGHGVIGRLVAEEEALMDGREVDEQGQAEEKQADQGQNDPSRAVSVLFHAIHAYHIVKVNSTEG